MRKVVIDTNTVVSAAITPFGNPAKILNMVLDGEISTFYCDVIMDEYIHVLSRARLRIATDIQLDIIRGIKRVGIPVDHTISNIPLPDESDRAFFDTAKENGAILITGNIKHYPPEAFVMTPSNFLALLEND